MSNPLEDRFEQARTVADAVLFEGYVLYPYRASAAKNQLRWQFGVLVPPAWTATTGNTPSSAPSVCWSPARATASTPNCASCTSGGARSNDSTPTADTRRFRNSTFPTGCWCPGTKGTRNAS